MKYIVVTGGVVSGLGKGITISSIGRVLQMCGLKTTSIKIDPYLNVDAGTMSPFEHGEVYVLDDGGEVDLDLGNYERFLDVKLSRDHNITTGKIYSSVINKERLGNYLGKTVQVVPHITDEIQNWIEKVAHLPIDDTNQIADVCLIEVGGTVGDIESMIFLEALRQFQFRVGTDNLCLFHVSLVPILGTDAEQKTKPTQHGVKELRSVGLNPNFIVCRSSEMLLESTKRKISIFCHVPQSHVITIHDVSNIYHVPLLLLQQDIATLIRRQLQMEMSTQPDFMSWQELAFTLDELQKDVRIAIVGKYTGLQDAYLSVIKALNHSSIAVKQKLVINWIEASDLELATLEASKELYDKAWQLVSNSNGIVIPGGFGTRGVEGKILCAKYCRENRIPLLGVCLGMQVMVIEYARSMLGWQNAHSAEFDEATDKKVVIFMPEIDPIKMGGTMRLGARVTKFYKLNSGEHSLSSLLYHSTDQIVERHRHRYEVNPESIDDLQQAGLNFVGKDITGERMEIVELPRSVHPFYIGAQYHPEFLSRPLKPAALFHGLLLAATGQLDDWIKNNSHL